MRGIEVEGNIFLLVISAEHPLEKIMLCSSNCFCPSWGGEMIHVFCLHFFSFFVCFPSRWDQFVSTYYEHTCLSFGIKRHLSERAIPKPSLNKLFNTNTRVETPASPGTRNKMWQMVAKFPGKKCFSRLMQLASCSSPKVSCGIFVPRLMTQSEFFCQTDWMHLLWQYVLNAFFI